jgi:hypothetical protein
MTESRLIGPIEGGRGAVGDYGVGVSRGTDQELLTERLRLRLPTGGDVGAVQRIHQDPAAVAHNPSDALAGPDAAQDLLPFAGWSLVGLCRADKLEEQVRRAQALCQGPRRHTCPR